MSAKKQRFNEINRCAKCGSLHLTYGVIELVGDQVYYPVQCDECDWNGQEWYKLTFIEMTSNDRL